MLHTLHPIRRVLAVAGLAGLGFAIPVHAQVQGASLDTGPWVFETFAQDYIKVSVLARGLDHPFGMVVLPGTATANSPLGDVLINERTGKVRIFRNGQLQDQPLIDLTEVFGLQQLFDIELHPDFSDNNLIYITWIKQAPNPNDPGKLWSTTAVARGRWDGNQLVDLEEVFEARPWSGEICGNSSRLHFLADDTFLLGISHRCHAEAPQSLDSHIGKILRLKDDGSVPADNPFFAVEGAFPEIYTWGNRSVMDFATHPQTGEIWELENGPKGGDEVNVLREPGTNYGWPVATFGSDYDGTRFSPPWVEGTELPAIFWVPSITVAGMAFYTGDKFPSWQNNLFVTSMLVGRTPGTGHLQRIELNEKGEEMSREMLLTELKQRIRYVVQGPDDLLYLLTDHSDGALLRLEPGTVEDARLFNSIQRNLDPAPAADEAIVFNEVDCQACHRTESALLGPSYREIAGRYDLTDDNVNMLADKVIQGGSGEWGDSPMTPHPTIDVAAAREMVRQILSL